MSNPRITDIQAALGQLGPFEPPPPGPEVREVPWNVPVGGQYDMFHENFKEHVQPPPMAPGARPTHMAEGVSRDGSHVMMARWQGHGLVRVVAHPMLGDTARPAPRADARPPGGVHDHSSGWDLPRMDLHGYDPLGEGREIGMIRGGRGIGPLMFHFGWMTGDNPLHSEVRTDEGLAFSRRVGGPDLRGYDQGDAVHTNYAARSASDPLTQVEGIPDDDDEH